MTKAVTPAEIDIQASFRARMYYAAPAVKVVAIPNAARRTRWEASRAKKEGLATGFPDIMCIGPDGLVAYIEFKSAKGTVSEAQREWIDLLRRYTFPATVARSADEALAFLREAGFAIRERVA
jgi:hypothetical protein